MSNLYNLFSFFHLYEQPNKEPLDLNFSDYFIIFPSKPVLTTAFSQVANNITGYVFFNQDQENYNKKYIDNPYKIYGCYIKSNEDSTDTKFIYKKPDYEDGDIYMSYDPIASSLYLQLNNSFGDTFLPYTGDRGYEQGRDYTYCDTESVHTFVQDVGIIKQITIQPTSGFMPIAITGGLSSIVTFEQSFTEPIDKLKLMNIQYSLDEANYWITHYDDLPFIMGTGQMFYSPDGEYLYHLYTEAQCDMALYKFNFTN